jgi:membrane protease YdiL (CAAX protease family)
MMLAMVIFAGADIVVQHGSDADLMERIQAEAQLQQQTGKLGPILSRGFGIGFIAAGIVSLIFTLIVLQVKLGSAWPKLLAIRLPRWDHLLLAILLLPALMILHGGAHQLANQLFQVDASASQMTKVILSIIEPWPRWLTILVIGVAPGLAEELWCRGYLGRGLIARNGWIIGVLLTSVFFGLLHLSPPYALGTAVMGAALHFTYITTRSLWVPILLHTLNNSLTVLITTGDLRLGKVDPDQVTSPLIFIASGLMLLAAGWALWQGRAKLNREKPYPSLELPLKSQVEARTIPLAVWLAVLGTTGLLIFSLVS